jgi:5-methylcytosine-specific restriction endonuclease McrA
MNPQPKHKQIRLPPKEWKNLVIKLIAKKANRCEMCKRLFPSNMLAPHHIKTRGSGGGDTLDNLMCLCKFCHYKIHNEGINEI